MRSAVLGALLGAGLVMAAVGATPNRGEVLAQRVGEHQPNLPDSNLIALSTTVDGQYQLVTVIDPNQRVMSVYQIELSGGDVKLCCVRNIHWDLQMLYFNGKNPLPPEIRSRLDALQSR